MGNASIIVAAANSLPEAKAKADFICDGIDDQVALLASLTSAPQVTAWHDINPADHKEITCYARHSVSWLPGDYYLSDTLVIPNAMDMVIDAEGTYFHYVGAEGDAVVIQGMNRCRYRLGTIESRSSGAALAIRPTIAMPALMSVVEFMGFIGHDQRGTGLLLDPTLENICVNRITGTDISGFDTGVRVKDPDWSKTSAQRSTAKCDTNQYWCSYIRQCNTGIWEGDTGNGIDCHLWTVNVDATLPGSVAIRTAANGNRWTIIMGTWEKQDTKALIIEKGAMDNRFNMRPSLSRGNHPADLPLGFPHENNSGNLTNTIE